MHVCYCRNGRMYVNMCVCTDGCVYVYVYVYVYLCISVLAYVLWESAEEALTKEPARPLPLSPKKRKMVTSAKDSTVIKKKASSSAAASSSAMFDTPSRVPRPQAATKSGSSAMLSDETVSKKVVTRPVKFDDLKAGSNFELCEGRVYCVGKLYKSDGKASSRRALFIFRTGEAVSVVAYSKMAEKMPDTIAVGDVVGLSNLRGGNVNPVFPVTDTPIELTYTPGTKLLTPVARPDEFPREPISRLHRTGLSSFPSKPKNERLDIVAKVLCPTLQSQDRLRNYFAGNALPTELTLLIVDDSNNIAKLFVDMTSGVHAIQAIADLIDAHVKRADNEPLVVRLRSVIHVDRNGYSLIGFKNLSTVARCTEHVAINNHEASGSYGIFPNGDEDIPTRIHSLCATYGYYSS